MRKRRLHGGEISAPAPPTAGAVKDNWRKMVEGELSLGVPCAPFTMSQYSVTDGRLEKEITVTGRKFPLEELRKKLLARQEIHAPTDR